MLTHFEMRSDAILDVVVVDIPFFRLCSPPQNEITLRAVYSGGMRPIVCANVYVVSSDPAIERKI